MDIDAANLTSGGRSLNGVANLDATDCYRIYEAVWRNMERENNLINHRITWAIVLTSGFLTAEAFIAGRIVETLSKPNLADSGPVVHILLSASCLFLALLSAFASWFCWRTHHGVRAALTQLLYLKTFYYSSRDGNRLLFEGALCLPRPFGDDKAHILGDETARTFPTVMLAIWALFALVQAIAFICLVAG